MTRCNWLIISVYQLRRLQNGTPYLVIQRADYPSSVRRNQLPEQVNRPTIAVRRFSPWYNFSKLDHEEPHLAEGIISREADRVVCAGLRVLCFCSQNGVTPRWKNKGRVVMEHNPHIAGTIAQYATRPGVEVFMGRLSRTTTPGRIRHGSSPAKTGRETRKERWRRLMI